MKQKSARESETLLSVVMMPMHANHYGNVHGGTILRLADEAAFVAATKHARRNVVLASMDHMSFDNPVKLGDMLHVKARLCHTGKSSMDVEVEVKTEKIKEGKTLHVGSAYLTMIALDEKGAPARVPGLLLENKFDKEKSRQALSRRRKRLTGAGDTPEK
jgi:uncharacterized protein (TIGR00369 family)